MDEFTSGRSDAIRAELIAHVAEKRQPRSRRILMAAGLVLAGALAGAGVSAAAFATTGTFSPSQPTPSYPDAVVAPPGVIPGAPIISMLGDPIIETIDSTMQISLANRPAEATHARVTITPLTPGSLSWGTSADGNNPSGHWNNADLLGERNPDAWGDFPLDDSVTTLYLAPSGFSGIATVQFVTHVPTLLGINEDGETYGIWHSISGDADLVAVTGKAADGNFVSGYVYRSELEGFSPDHPGLPSNPEEAIRWQEERNQKYPGGWEIPVYRSDGVTQIGVFTIGG